MQETNKRTCVETFASDFREPLDTLALKAKSSYLVQPFLFLLKQSVVALERHGAV